MYLMTSFYPMILREMESCSISEFLRILEFHFNKIKEQNTTLLNFISHIFHAVQLDFWHLQIFADFSLSESWKLRKQNVPYTMESLLGYLKAGTYPKSLNFVSFFLSISMTGIIYIIPVFKYCLMTGLISISVPYTSFILLNPKLLEHSFRKSSNQQKHLGNVCLLQPLFEL